METALATWSAALPLQRDGSSRRCEFAGGSARGRKECGWPLRERRARNDLSTPVGCP